MSAEPCDGCGTEEKTVLLYACSGGANVGEVADSVARHLMFEGRGIMFCLAGVGADEEDMIEKAKNADVNLILDGCDVDCAKKVFDNAGITNYEQIRVTDLGVEKSKGVRATDHEIGLVADRVRQKLATL